jgi:hypothetical protein
VTRTFGIYLGIVGFAALTATAWPPIVLIGLLLGIVPGILLGLSPTLFLYSLLWWCIRELLAKLAGFARIPTYQNAGAGARRFILPILSAAILAIPAFLIPRAINARIDDATAALQVDDREPSTPVTVPPTVAIVMDRNYHWSARRPYCETLCLLLLYNSAASRVIVQDPAHPRAITAFSIERREQCPEMKNFHFDVTWKTDFPLRRGHTPEERVRARMTAGECLIESEGRLEDAVATISYRSLKKGMSVFEHSWAIQADTADVNRLEITGANGAVMYRRTEVATQRLATPLQIGTAAGFLTTVIYAGWARSKLTVAEIGPHGRDVLPLVLGATVRTPDGP